MVKFQDQDKCPNCGYETVKFQKITFPWYVEDEDRAGDGFRCCWCHKPVEGLDMSNLIQLKFFGSQFSFQNENALVEGQITDQSHQIDLLMQAMKLARDEGKELRVSYESGTLHFKAISDKDIETYCK